MRWRTAGMPRGPTSSSRSRARSMPAARRAAPTRCGRTATCPTARPSTHAARSRLRSSASRRASATSCAPAAPAALRDLEAANANHVGGDINGGSADLRQLLARPVARAIPYATPNPRVFVCSSSTPPGGGVHGMCGAHAARAALGGALTVRITTLPTLAQRSGCGDVGNRQGAIRTARTHAPPHLRRRATAARSPRRRRVCSRCAAPSSASDRYEVCRITRERAWMAAWIWTCH